MSESPATGVQSATEPKEGENSEAVTPPDSAAVSDPTGAETVAAEPEATETVVAQPEPAEPEAAKPVAAEPESAEPTAAEPAAASPAAPTPKPRPVPKPTALRPAPIPRPTAGPQAVPASAPVAPAPVADDPELIAAAAAFGTVAADGTVSVRDGDNVRVVGQVVLGDDPSAYEAEALDLYIRRFLDLRTKVLLFETRLLAGSIAPNDATSTLKSLTAELAEPNAVGDLPQLRAKVEELHAVAAEQAKVAEAARQAAREKAIEERTAIVEAAEALAATDPSRVQWKSASDALHKLLEQWKSAQKAGPRIDRPTEDALWKRFSHARTSFDRERRHFFSALEQQHATAKAEKEKLIAEAEKLSTSIAWGETAAAYRDLMTRWKAAGHAGRKDDDLLWSRFRAAQDKFFTARSAASSELDAEFSRNLEVKEGLLTEAEALLPISDIAFAKRRLRDIQDRWEAAGKVPREAMHSVEARLRAVESAVRDFEEEQWQRSNPEVQARASGLSAQLIEAIERMEAELAQAKAAKNDRAAKEIEEGLAARRAWLSQIEKSVGE